MKVYDFILMNIKLNFSYLLFNLFFIKLFSFVYQKLFEVLKMILNMIMMLQGLGRILLIFY